MLDGGTLAVLLLPTTASPLHMLIRIRRTGAPLVLHGDDQHGCTNCTDSSKLQSSSKQTKGFPCAKNCCGVDLKMSSPYFPLPNPHSKWTDEVS